MTQTIVKSFFVCIGLVFLFILVFLVFVTDYARVGDCNIVVVACLCSLTPCIALVFVVVVVV